MLLLYKQEKEKDIPSRQPRWLPQLIREQRVVRVFMPGLMQAFQLGRMWVKDPYRLVLSWEILAIVVWASACAAFWYYMLPLVGFSSQLAFWLFAGFGLAPLHYLTSSGLLALSLWTLGLTLLIAGSRPPSGSMHVWGALVCMFFAAWIRTAYLPLLLLPMVGLVSYASFRQVKPFQYISLGAAILGGYALLLAHSTALFAYNETVSKGFFPSHLLHTEPFIVKAFLYWGLPHELAFESHLRSLWIPIKVVLHLGSLLLMGLMGRAAYFLGKDSLQWRLLGYVMLATTALVLGMLGYQSITTPPETWNWTGFWTFVMEPRYFAPIMMGIVLMAFGMLGTHGAPGRKGLKMWLTGVLIVNVGFSLWLHLRTSLLGQTEGTFEVEMRRKELQQASQIQKQSTIPLVWMIGSKGMGPAMEGIPVMQMDSLLFVPDSAEPFCVISFASDSTFVPDSARWKRLPDQPPFALYVPKGAEE